ncbi:metallophosphoesterase domain-containing 1 [Pyrrhoderma noxium]|uniref:Metallophosphoesterase domain-containing 1 n=1 Tax=Pyrrhoderma noxium TaxID=2282107 RepID=A0A286U815_9AGAM|nr:metallophosphoesterase domain-containing 1 [Pyrrhoderma noxium]
MQQEKLRPIFAALSRHSFMNTRNRSKTDSASPSGASDSHSTSKPTKKHREGRRNWLGLRSPSKLTNSTGKRQIKDKTHQATADPLAGKLDFLRQSTTTTYVKVVVISDTYDSYKSLRLPSGDILIHCGNLIRKGGDKQSLLDALNWLNSQEGYTKIFWVSGNADESILSDSTNRAEVRDRFPNLKYLRDETYTIKINHRHLKVYGKVGGEADTVRTDIPPDVDVVICGNDYVELSLMQKIGNARPQALIVRHPEAQHGVGPVPWSRALNRATGNNRKNEVIFVNAYAKPLVFQL